MNYIYSSNGTSWSIGGIPGGPYGRMSFCNGTFFATGDTGAIATSTDGINWSNIQTLGTSPNVLGEVVWAPVLGLFVLNQYSTDVGAYFTGQWTSPTGATWTVTTTDPLNQGGQNAYREPKAGLGLVGMGTTVGGVYSGTNIYSTTLVPPWSTNGGASGYLVFGGTRFVSFYANNSNGAWYSTDGMNWSAGVNVGSNGYASYAGYLLGNFVGCLYGIGGSGGIVSPDIVYSPDGATWSSAKSPYWPTYTQCEWVGGADNGTLALLVGGTNIPNIAATSTNLSSWSTTPLPAIGTGYTGIAYGAGLFLAVTPIPNPNPIVMLL